MATEAARIRAGTRLRLPDALVRATAISIHAAAILKTDTAWKSVDRRVRILGHAAS
ncbi:MAG: type II toxin-antitoxin system VapC family toxin [Chloroflexi bacterium]|nr:type II toxin-antitoxin system VapC family toxin [Chloroflexota bacterium]